MKITQEDTTAFEQWLNAPIDWDATGKPITNLSAMKHYRPIPDEETGIINYSSIMFAFFAGRESMRPQETAEEKREREKREFNNFIVAARGLEKL
jgi:hypothetical protein